MILQDIVLGIVQGFTEFLPISSSAHLAVLPRFFDWPDQGMAFDAAIHLGTLLAVIVYFRQRIWQIISKKDWRFIKLLTVGTVATVVMVLAVRFAVFRSPQLIAFNLIFWAMVLLVAEKYNMSLQGARVSFSSTKRLDNPNKNWRQVIFIGLAQGLAILPGTSRSGITISAGLFGGLTKDEAIEFSFLLGIPIILLAGLSSILNLTQEPSLIFAWTDLLLATVLAFASGWLAIYLLLKIVQKIGLAVFVWYRIALGILILLII